MKNPYSAILLILIVTVFSSCEETIDFELNNDENSRLVIEGSITNQKKVHTIKLTRTTSYYHNQEAPTETEATVTISDEKNTYTLTETSPGIYQTDTTVQGIVGNTYILNISTKDNKSYSATSTLASVAPIDTITYEYVNQHGQGGVDEIGYELQHWGPEPLGLGNNYMWLVYINNKLVTNKISDITFVMDEFVDGNYIAGFGFYIIEQELKPTDTLNVTVEMHSISRSYHDFMMAVMLETDWRGMGGGLFDGPPANIPSNVSNGAIGYFRASAVSSMRIEVFGK